MVSIIPMLVQGIGDIKMKKYNAVIVGLTFYAYCSDQTPEHFTIQQSAFYNYPNSERIAYLFAHGLGASQKQAISLSNTNISNLGNDFCIIGKPLVLFDFPDARTREDEYRAKYVNLGQKRDLQRLHSVYHRALAELPDHNFVLMGLSRGAAAILNYVALYDPQKIRALVIESSFDTIKGIIKNLMRRFHVDWLPFSMQIGMKIAQSQFPDLDVKGIFPLDTIVKLPKDIPIILIHSKKDKVIPIKSSRKIYLVLKSLGYENIYLLELSEGLHGKLMQGPEAEIYQNVVHAFYKKCNLPCNDMLALKGEPFLPLCQPSIPEIVYRIKRKK